MRTLEEFNNAGQEIYSKLHLASHPLGITYIKDEGQIPEWAHRPSKAGKKLSFCQAYTLARRWGMPVAMTADDNFCTPATGFYGWGGISREDLIESQVRQGWHKDRQAEERRIDGARMLMNSKGEDRMKGFIGFVCSPLQNAKLIPDTILIYGDGVQIMHMIHGINYAYKHLTHSFFEGFGESCVKGGLLPFLLDSPQVVIPGMGDRSFAGIGENELAIGMPANMLFELLEDLFKTGGNMNMGYPAKTMLPMDITENITPGFKYLRKKMNERQS
jgi:uncharacterized protein (DUF169 family)